LERLFDAISGKRGLSSFCRPEQCRFCQLFALSSGRFMPADSPARAAASDSDVDPPHPGGD
jgi:hypothetical protein